MSQSKELVTNIAPRQLSYFISLIDQISTYISEEEGITIPKLAVLESLPNAIKYGFAKPEKLAFYAIKSKTNSYLGRVAAHNSYAIRIGNIEVVEDNDNYKTVFTTMKNHMEVL